LRTRTTLPRGMLLSPPAVDRGRRGVGSWRPSGRSPRVSVAAGCRRAWSL